MPEKRLSINGPVSATRANAMMKRFNNIQAVSSCALTRFIEEKTRILTHSVKAAVHIIFTWLTGEWMVYNMKPDLWFWQPNISSSALYLMSLSDVSIVSTASGSKYNSKLQLFIQRPRVRFIIARYKTHVVAHMQTSEKFALLVA